MADDVVLGGASGADTAPAPATSEVPAGSGSADVASAGGATGGDASPAAGGQPKGQEKTAAPEGASKSPGPNWGDESKALAAELIGADKGEAFDKLVKDLGRYASRADWMKAGLAAQERARDPRWIRKPGKDAKPEEIAAWNKQLGIPDTIDAYKWDPPKGPDGQPLPETPLDKAMDQVYRERALKAGFTPEQYRTGREALAAVQQMAAQQIAEHAAKVNRATQDALTIEYRGERDANIELANRWLIERLGDGVPDMMKLEMRDGTRLGDYLPFVKLIVAEAKAGADAGTMLAPDGSTAVDIDAKINAIMALAHSSDLKQKAEYESRQPELMKLIEAKERRGRGRAA